MIDPELFDSYSFVSAFFKFYSNSFHKRQKFDRINGYYRLPLLLFSLSTPLLLNSFAHDLSRSLKELLIVKVHVWKM